MKHKTYKFGDIDRYQAVTGRRQRFMNAVLELKRTIKHPVDRKTLSEFVTFIQPRSLRDKGMLPYYSHRPTSKEYNKSACVFSLISYTVQLWWCFLDQENGFGTRVLDRHIGRLEKYAAKGLNAFDLRGTYKTGYWLRERK